MVIPPWLLKIAVQQAAKPKNLKKVFFIIAGIILAVLLVCTTILLPLSFLNGEKITTDYDISQSAAYKEIFPIYQEYQTELLEYLNQLAEETKNTNATWEEDYSYNAITGQNELDGGHYEYPTVNVITVAPPIDVLLAYIIQKDTNLLKAKKYKANANDIKGFYRNIVKIDISGSGMDYSITAAFLTVQEIADLYFTRESDKNLFLESIAIINGFLKNSAMAGMGSNLNLSTSAIKTLNKIFNQLIGNGYSSAAASGICGNIQQECNFNFKLSGKSNGIVQWQGARFTQLENMAKQEGTSWQDLDTQIKFLLSEMRSPVFGNRLNKYANSYAGATTFEKVTDPELAAFIFCAVVEGCEYKPELGWGTGTGSIMGPDGRYWQQLTQRQNYARNIFQAIAGGGSSSLGSVAQGSSSEKLAALFPNGLPKTQEEIDQYTETIPVSIWDGNKKVTKYVVLHRALKEDTQAIFEDIANAHVQMKSVGGIRAFGTNMNNGGTSTSHHCYGVAIDIDPDFNPSGIYAGNPMGVKPGTAYYYTNSWQPQIHPLSITPEGIVVRAFESRGWVWGAKWGTVNKPRRQPVDPGYHDFMHFSFTGR